MMEDVLVKNRSTPTYLSYFQPQLIGEHYINGKLFKSQARCGDGPKMLERGKKFRFADCRAWFKSIVGIRGCLNLQ